MALKAPQKSTVAEDLAKLPDLYDSCFHEITCKRSAISPTRVRGPRNTNQFNEEAVEIRKDIHEALLSWARVAVERLGAPVPESSVGGLAAFLVSQLDRLTGFTAAPEFAAEVAGLRLRAEQVAEGAAVPRSHDLGPCVETACAGRLTATPSPGRSAASKIVCDQGHAWQPREWLMLSQQLDEQRTS
jgi:hypothetical protein